MLALGIILIVLAAGVLVLAVAGASNQVASFDLGAFSVEMTTLGVFFAGAATVLLLLLGLGLLRAGVRRANRRRKEKKELHRLTEQLETREKQGSEPSTASSTPATTAATKDEASSKSDPGGSDDETVATDRDRPET